MVALGAIFALRASKAGAISKRTSAAEATIGVGRIITASRAASGAVRFSHVNWALRARAIAISVASFLGVVVAFAISAGAVLVAEGTMFVGGALGAVTVAIRAKFAFRAKGAADVGANSAPAGFVTSKTFAN